MTLPGRCLAIWLCGFAATGASAADPGVAVLLVDTDRVPGTIDERLYGQFLEEINHSVVDGLYAEQVRGQGFEGKDFADYWTPFGTSGEATLVATAFERGERSVRLTARAGTAGIRQGRVYVEAGQKYDGSVWLNRERGTLAVSLRIVSGAGRELANQRLKNTRRGWQEVAFEFTSPATDRQASLELVAAGTGSVLVDFISLMRADARHSGKLRPDLLAALQGLAPPNGYLQNLGNASITPWINLLVVYDVIFLAVSYMVFDYIVEE